MTARFKKKRSLFLMLAACSIFSGFSAFGQSSSQKHVYTIDIDTPEKEVYDEHLKLGGSRPGGDKIAVNNYYLSINEKPFIPITGEFHFSRYPEQYWDESIKKMKAGGINMMATYVFWNMHEEKEGEFNWEGSRNLRRFIELCAENDLPAIVRIGPFCHGEIRNGGLPDWLLGKPLTIRSNDPDYLFYAERLYKEIGEQLKGLYFKDGGPVLGIQLENEFQHSAAPWGLTYPGQPHDFTSSDRDRNFTMEGVGISNQTNPYAELGNKHMQVLKNLAQKAGMEVPLYTATGWGNAAIIPNESIPVTAAYAYPTWTRKKDLSPFYLYKDMHKSPDYAPVRYNPEDYPAFAAELGGGIMSTYDRRPLVPAKSMDALINRCLGSGANGIGYYMYHGGSTPRGEHYFFNDEAYGYPKISYDFQAPIGEFGQIRESFHRLKLLHSFINSFGELLAPMSTVLPENNADIKPANIELLRFSVRRKNSSGFLFVNNFQDDTLTTDKTGVQIKIKTAKGELLIPESPGFKLKSGENAIFPFNFQLEGLQLNYATAQLLTKGKEGNKPYYVFFAPEGVQPEFSFATTPGLKIRNISKTKITKNAERWLVTSPEKGISEFALERPGAADINILVVDKALALQSWPVTIKKQQHLLFTEADVLQNGNSLELISRAHHQYQLFIYPKINDRPVINTGKVSSVKHPSFSGFSVALPEVHIPFTVKEVSRKQLYIDFKEGMPAGINDVFLNIDYLGDTGMGFINGALVTDEFYKGIPWQIGLKNFLNQLKAEDMSFYFRPIFKKAPYLVDLEPESIPDFTETPSIVDVKAITFVPEYKSTINFGK